MARNRQRAKQRQAERRAARLGDGEQAGDAGAERSDEPASDGRDDAKEREELLREADLDVGAPPHDLGRSDSTLEHAPASEDEHELEDELEDYDFEDEEQPVDEPAAAGPRGVRGGRSEPKTHGRNRLVAFLIAVWAELQRVQWPNRKQLTQMTGIVLVFVLIAGGYLGLLDAIFSRLIQAIL
jgi:preprotein translocase SecE subunit